MLARITWIVFASCALVVVPGVFYFRYRRWPVLSCFPSRDAHSIGNLLYGLAQAAYTAMLILGADPQPTSTAGGLIVFAVGATLAAWAVVTLGPNWRIGQDPCDQTVFFVSRGPFRFMRHPIYVGLIIISAGQGLLTGFDGRAFLLIVASAVYLVVQGRGESRYWETRS